MFELLNFSYVAALMMSGGIVAPEPMADAGVQAEGVQVDAAPLIAGEHAEFLAGAAACAAFLEAGDVSVFEGSEPARQIIPGEATSVFFPRVGNNMRFVISANGIDPSARQCTGTGPAGPSWEAFLGAELAVLKPVLAQYQLVELDFSAEPVLFGDCGQDPANVYFIFSPGGPGGVVFAGNTGPQAASFCNLYGPKE